MASQNLRTFAALVTLVLLNACGSGPASFVAPNPPQTLRAIVFPGGWNLPIWIARDKGLFARNGVDIQVTDTPNSQFQMVGLIDGKFDLAMTAIDNIVAYREGQGAAPVDGSDLVAVMGGDQGFLRLVSVPEVRSIAALKGRTLSVDALTTGYAFVLLEIMARNGLELGRDYQTERAGGGMERYNALLEKKHAATLLISPLDVLAVERGFNRLADASQALGRYQGLVAGVRRSWAAKNPGVVSGYIRAYAEAVEWSFDPRNRDEAIAIFMKYTPKATRAAAEASYALLTHPSEGMQRKAAIDLRGVATALDLRAKYSRPQRSLGAPTSYYTADYYDRAVR
jgi:ABC-type nitrate/sulfonate/bicarbonate transport system substrate-binding protein